MTANALRVAGLAAIYLLVLTSLAPGDVAVGLVLGGAILLATRSHGGRRTMGGWRAWLLAFGRMVVVTAWDIVTGTVRVVRFCLLDEGSPGFVEIPRDGRSRREVALWGVLTGEAPDEYPVALDAERDVLVVHHVDARDPDAVRARHAAARDRYQHDVVA